MKPWLLPLLLGLASAAPALANPGCQFEKMAAGPQKIGPWIDRGNWLNIEHRSVSLRSPSTFMPALRLAPAKEGALRSAARQLDLDAPTAVDPLDGSQQSLSFLLASRLHADGLLILRNGSIVAEHYRNGWRPEYPRPLLDGARPLLTVLASTNGVHAKLAGKKSVLNFIPALNKQAGLRKLSVQRLLDGDEGFSWSANELADWKRAAGWTGEPTGGSLRAWLAAPGRWERPLQEETRTRFAMTPDLDLLAWLLAESQATPLAELFCAQLLPRNAPEHPLLWLTDTDGRELGGGLALSLRDFARLGQQLLAARTPNQRSKIPGWLVETLAAPTAARHSPGMPAGLPRGSENRYGFIRLGDGSAGVALIAGHGTSLYIDFDQKLVIALYAAHPKEEAPILFATLQQFWKAATNAARIRAEAH